MAKIPRTLNYRDITLYGLSTCGWCKKVEKLLDAMGLSYVNIYVDRLEREDREMIKVNMKDWNPEITFPTLVIDNKKCVIGYDEPRIVRAVEYD
jgi:glutaredoxin